MFPGEKTNAGRIASGLGINLLHIVSCIAKGMREISARIFF